MSLIGPKNGTTSSGNNLSPDGDLEENSCCESDEDFVNNQQQQTTAPMTSQQSKINQSGGNSNKSPGQSTLRSLDSRPSVHDVYAEMPASSTYIEGMSPMQLFNEERMRRKLQFFFMNPIEKWQARRRFPYKFVVQVVKIILVTMQLCLFAHSRYNHINYTWDNRISFSHLFLKGWDSTRETESYPPSNGPLAIYEKRQFYDTIDFAIVSYANVSRSIGPYDYPSKDNQMAPMKLCLHSYRQGIIFGFNESYIFNPEIVIHCESLTKNVSTIGIEKFLQQRDVNVSFSALVEATLSFGIKTINFKAYGPLSAPDCFKFEIKILFNNRDHDGQMLLSLDADAMRLHCRGDIEYITDTELDTILRTILNMLVILICMLSFGLCARAIYRAQLLRIQTVNFFRVTYKKELSFDGKMEFINMWYIMIIFNDLLLIIGSAMKEQIERKFLVIDGWDICSVFLGIGNLLVWIGVLRYLGFFKTYNVVILTLQKAAPKIARFLFCALLIYAGFTFCGWLVLGPYHLKFRSLATTSECLFALINGDDMFATFATLSSNSSLLWVFCQVYLYSFISLYIYVVLSLFIAVIMDAYDTIKRYYGEGFPVSDLREFVGTRTEEDITSGVFLTDFDDFGDSTIMNVLRRAFCCFSENETPTGPTGYTSLHTVRK
ncbi:mucolipin-3-like [Episyrphus balteatus]|uniref:mucolipin-3-like n=1 Tax=Episyrphus balteatus TaxID=286459 RepID=UPI002486008A|nr:mucolipin-3-like [Episyrphus balteatus]